MAKTKHHSTMKSMFHFITRTIFTLLSFTLLAANPIKVAVITNQDGAHLSQYFAALAESEDFSSVIISDPEGQTVLAARIGLQ